MVFFTYLNNENFEFDWLRKVKSIGEKCIVYGPNLFIEQKDQIKNLGFEVISENPYNLMADIEGHSVFFVKHIDIPSFFAGEKVVCSGISDYSLERIVKPINHLFQRVKIAGCLDKIIKKHGGLLACDYVLAPQNFWIYLQGVYKKWVDNNYVDKNLFVHDLMVNFCVSFYDYEVEKGK